MKRDVHEEFENRFQTSELYGTQTIQELAPKLGKSVSQLRHLSRNAHKKYRVYPIKQKNGKSRTIEAPQGTLKVVQQKIKEILDKERSPIYLSSPAKGRSPLSNVETHRERKGDIVEIDLHKFFPSCRSGRVYWLFLYTMRCSPEVSWILTSLVCFKGHLPTGAPTSPLIAFYAYEESFTRFYGLIVWHRPSLWVDNLNFSCMYPFLYSTGKEIIEQVQTDLNLYGLRLNRGKSRIYKANESAYITGYHLLPNGDIRVRNAIHRRWYEAKEQRKTATGDDRKLLTQKMNTYKRLIEDVEKSNKCYRKSLQKKAARRIAQNE